MKTLTIIQPAHPGLLTEITTILAERNLNISDIDASIADGQAVITLSVESSGKAFQLLSDAGYRVIAARYILLRINNRPGELARLSRRLSHQNIDIRSIHIISKKGDNGIVALESADHDRAREILSALLV